MSATKLKCCVAQERGVDSSTFFEEEDDDSEEEPLTVKTYRRYWIRWLMLLALFILNTSNGMMWLTYAPIPDKTAAFYNITSQQVDFFSISFFITSLIVGFFSMFVLDTCGLGPAVLVGALLNGFGALVRLISALPAVNSNPLLYHNAGYAIAMCGQVLTAAAQPFILYAPTKFAVLWFGDKERGIPTALASMANPLGIAVAFLASPHLVVQSADVFTLSWVYLIPAGVGVVLTVLTFWRNRPPTPPSLAAEHKQDSFFKGVKSVLIQWQFIVLLLVWGAGAGLMNSFLTLVPQFLCPFGYDDTFSGLWVAVMIFCGLVGALVAGILLDCTKRFDEIAKIALSLSTLSLVWFLQVFNREDQAANIAVCLCVFGFLAFVLMPACLELGVEITYPVAESTSSGLLWSAAQIFGAVLTFVGPFLGTELSWHQLQRQKCSLLSDNEAKDMTYSVIFYVAMAAAALLLFVTLFHPKYKRTMEEKKAKQKSIPDVPSPTAQVTQELIT